MLFTADDALKSAAKARDRTSKGVDKKFEEAIDLLTRFEKDFRSKDQISDPSVGGMTTGETNMTRSDTSKFPSTILHALKMNLHAKVKFSFASLPLKISTPTNPSQ